jgi:hypothetical protein
MSPPSSGSKNAWNQRESGSKFFVIHLHAFVHLPFLCLFVLLKIFEGMNHQIPKIQPQRGQKKKISVFKETTRSFALLATCFIMVCLIPRPWRWRRYVPFKFLSIFNGPHGVISQMIESFLITPVRTWIPAHPTCSENHHSTNTFFFLWTQV